MPHFPYEFRIYVRLIGACLLTSSRTRNLNTSNISFGSVDVAAQWKGVFLISSIKKSGLKFLN